jgi:hypothetical protein
MPEPVYDGTAPAEVHVSGPGGRAALQEAADELAKGADGRGAGANPFVLFRLLLDVCEAHERELEALRRG